MTNEHRAAASVALDVQIKNLVGACERFREERGSVHVLMHPDCSIAAAGVTAVGGVPLHIEETTLLNTKTGVERDKNVAEVQLHARCPFADDAGRCSEDPDHDPRDGDWWGDDD